MELWHDGRENHPAGRARRQQAAAAPGHDRIACTDTVCYGRRITIATYGPGTADGPQAAGQFQTLAEIARHGAVRSSYRRRWEWATPEAARAGHQDIARWLTGVAAWLAGATDQIPPPPQAPSSGGPPMPAPGATPDMPAPCHRPRCQRPS